MITIQEIKNKLQVAMSDLQSRYPIGRLAVFGSATRSDFTPESDIDIMVEFNGEIGWEFFELNDELEKLFERKVDLVTREAIKPHYWEYIKKDVQYV